MKKRVLIAAALAGVFYLQSGFAWAANPPRPDQENTQIHDQQQIPAGQPVTQQNRTGNDAKIGAANTGKEQGPAPVILRIRLVNKTAD
jgi:hypothetical protein